MKQLVNVFLPLKSNIEVVRWIVCIITLLIKNILVTLKADTVTTHGNTSDIMWHNRVTSFSTVVQILIPAFMLL